MATLLSYSLTSLTSLLPLTVFASSVFLVGSAPCTYPLLLSQLLPGSSSTDTLWLGIPIPGSSDLQHPAHVSFDELEILPLPRVSNRLEAHMYPYSTLVGFFPIQKLNPGP